MSSTDSNSMLACNPQNREENKPKNHSDHHLFFKVQASDGDEVWFKMKATCSFRKAMNVWCDKHRVKRATIVFLFEGRRVAAAQTPHDLGMQDGDAIDAMAHYFGGGSCN